MVNVLGPPVLTYEHKDLSASYRTQAKLKKKSAGELGCLD